MDQRSCRILVALFSLGITACGGGGGDSAGSASGSGNTVTPPASNRAPVLTMASSHNMREVSEAVLTFSASDPDNDNLTFSVQSSSALVSASVNGSSVLLKANKINELPSQKAAETVQIKLTARDASVSTEQTLNLTVENVAPALSLKILAGAATQRTVQDNVLLSTAYPQTLSLVAPADLTVSNLKASTSLATQVFVTSTPSLQIQPAQVQNGTLLLSGDTELGMFERSFTVNVDQNRGPQLAIMGPPDKAVAKGVERQFTIALIDPDNDAVTVTARSLDSARLTASATTTALTVKGLELGQAKVEITYSDGRTDFSTQLPVDVVDNAEPPQITIGGLDYADMDPLLNLQEQTETLFTIGVKDADSSSHQISIEQLNQAPEEYRQVPVSAKVNAGRYETTLLADRIAKDNRFPEGYARLRLTVSDGKFTTAKDVRLVITRKPNPLPEFRWTGGTQEFGTFVQPESATSQYQLNITDDEPAYLTFEQSYLGDVSDFLFSQISQQFDPLLRQMTVTTTEATAGGKALISTVYYDGDTRIQSTFPLRISVSDSVINQEARQFVRQIQRKIAAMQEYQLVARFYTDVLQSRNLISSHQAKRYLDAFRADTSPEQRFSSYRSTARFILKKAYAGEYDRNPTLLAQDKTSLGSMEAQALELHRAQLPLLNEMADLSGGLLPRLDFDTSLSLTDSGFYSRFAGDPTYGKPDANGKWQYLPTFSFMAAVQAQAEQAASGSF